jgi:GT2 family glycosyltransferase
LNTLSIIIVAYNSAGTIEACLQSLVQSIGTLFKYEIIVVDNNSTDATVPIIEKRFPSVLLLKNKINEGFAVAANVGARRSAGDLLLFINPDAEVFQDFMGGLVRVLDAYPRCGIMGFQFVDIGGIPQPSSWRTPGIWTLFVESCLPYPLSLPLVTVSSSLPSRVEMVSGGSMVIRRELFESLNGFDEDYFLYYEDSDLCLRARRTGSDIMFIPSLKIIHHGRGSFNNGHGNFFSLYYSGKLVYCSKHFPRRRYWIARKMILAGIILRIAAYRCVALLSMRVAWKTLASDHLKAFRSIRAFDIR